MSVFATPRSLSSAAPTTDGTTTVEPRIVCLTFGPAAEPAHLLRIAADALEHAGATVTALEPSTGSGGAWLRVTCAVDPADVATLVAMPSLGDHRVQGVAPGDDRCPACELRAYVRSL